MTHYRLVPVRVQMKRTKGFRLQEASPNGLPVVYVGRPTKWGNPFKVGAKNPYGTITQDQRHAFMLYLGFAPINDALVAAAQAELRGKNLACWCRETPGERTCHADVLLEISNS